LKKFSIIIPTYNREALLNELLQSLIVQKFNSEDFEIIVVDNNSVNNVSKSIADFVAKYPQFDIKYFNEEKQGVQYAWNRGIAESKGELLIFVDDDVTFHTAYFETLENDFSDNLDNISGGGKIAPVFEHQKPAWISKYVMPYFIEINLGEKSTFPKKHNPFASNMLVSKKIIDKVGAFDTEKFNDKSVIIPGTFERDLFARIRKAGLPVYYFHDLLVWHFIPEEKIEKKYVKQHFIEAGKTYRDIHLEKGFIHYLYVVWLDLLKWLAAFVLSTYYIFTTQWEKVSMLLKVRWWRSKGLLSFSD
jgi:glycosyltransferase involved in cell wall biosynthesis